jgi:putative hydrolase of the HAD superfamily
MVRSVRSDIRTGVLSNTNELHWETQPDNQIIRGLCQHNYVSYQLGLLKPDVGIFDHVVADLAVEAGRVLFIDDNQANVDGARSAGLRSEMAKGPTQAGAVLDGYGLRALR